MLDRLIDLIKEWLEFLQFVTIIDSYERGVVLRWGRLHRVLEPGLHWYWPLNVEQVFTHPVVLDTMPLREQSLTTADGVSVVLTGVISYEVVDVAKLLLEVQGARNAIEDAACGVIGDKVVRSTWQEVSDAAFANAVAIEVRRNAKKYGIHVTQLLFQDLTKSRSLRVWNSSTSTPSPL